MDDVKHAAFRTYWQPRGADVAQCMADLEVALPDLMGMHVYWEDSREQRPLVEGADLWRAAFRRVREASAGGGRCPPYAMLEFVMGGTVEQMQADAAVLRQWLDEIATETT